jgi:pimeloyl-ACP methyl ester carboxylesterase
MFDRRSHLPRAAVAACALLATLAGCGGHSSAPQAPHGSPVIVGPGRLVPIGGGRTLYLRCQGTGSPTVILEAGFGGNRDNWSAVQPALGETTRTCAYDRAGLGSSLPMRGVHDAADEVADLGKLLQAAHIPPPYVLAGHSYGGLLVRLFAAAHPGETAGVVLVDAMGRDQDARFRTLWRAQPAHVRRLMPAPAAPTDEDGVNLRAGEALDARVRSLGHIPLLVVSRGRTADDDKGLPAGLRRGVMRLWTRMQDELAGLSPDHVHVVAVRSGHFVQSYVEGQPGVVVRAVRAVVRAARTGDALPACRRLFTGAGVRCSG